MTEGAPLPVAEMVGVTKEYHLSLERAPWRALVPGPWGELRFPDGFRALDDVSLSVAPGAMLGIVGRNGAGKSTALKVLAGLVEPTAGTVVRRGRTVPVIELGVGFDLEFTGRENVHFAAEVLGLDSALVAERYDDIVAFAGLADVMDTPLKRYSTGMVARLGFSLATSVDADLVLVDEVLAVGDEHFRRRSLDRVREAHAAGTSFVVVSHDHRTLSHLCDELVLLERGRVSERGDPAAVLDRYLGPAEGATDLQAALEAGGGDAVVAAEAAIEPGGRTASPVAITDLRVDRDLIAPGDDIGFRAVVHVERPLPDAHLWACLFTYGNSICAEPVTGPREVLATPGRWEVAGTLHDLPLSSGHFELRLAASATALADDRRFHGAYAEASAAFGIQGAGARPGIHVALEWDAERRGPAGA